MKKNKGQSILEYSFIAILIVAALLSMQVYIKRGMQGRMRSTADELGQQYEPGNTVGRSDFTYNSTTVTNVTTRSERELGLDLDGDGAIENDVYGTESVSSMPQDRPTVTTQREVERVGRLNETLF